MKIEKRRTRLKCLYYWLIAITAVAIFSSCSDDEKFPPVDIVAMNLQVTAKANHPDLRTDLFPSFLYQAEGLRAYYKDNESDVFTDQVLELTFKNPVAGTQIELMMRESPLTEPLSWLYTTGEDELVKVTLPVKWKREHLRTWKENALLTFVWDVSINNRETQTLHQTFTCHDIREFPERIFVKDRPFVGTLRADGEGAIYPAALISAYINEDNPLAKELMQKAVTDGAIDHFDGYARGDEHVVEQLGAMWYILLASNMAYGNHCFVPGYWSEYYIFRLRSIDEMLSSNTGNCMELPMLMMAMCHQAGLKVVSFHVNNGLLDHMFFAVLDRRGQPTFFLNPAYLERVKWEDKTLSERLSFAKKQLMFLLEVSKTEYDYMRHDIITGYPHFEAVYFEKVRQFIPSFQ